MRVCFITGAVTIVEPGYFRTDSDVTRTRAGSGGEAGA
jgi:hypothetical protein